MERRKCACCDSRPALTTLLAFVEPQHRYISMFLVIIGVSALARDIRLHEGMDEL
jgi:hypothetical protein